MKRFLVLFMLLAIPAAFIGCAAHMAPMDFKPHAFGAGQYTPKVDNFVIIMDASMTMGSEGQKNLQSTKNFVSSVNQSIPTDLNMNGGLRTFGHSVKQSKNLTDLVYGMTKYTRSGLQQGLDSVKYAGGNSPLPAALDAAAKDLASAQGNSAVIVVSDGLQMAGAPAAAQRLKEQLGSKVCIYTVWIGDDAKGKVLLDKVAQAGQCGSSATGADLASSSAMAAFVEKVFLTKKMAKGPCPDSDGDGVCDDRDKCPGTLPGVMVDKDGCALKFTLQIEFDFDKADIRPEYHSKIAEAAAFVKRYPDTQILVAGHTDSTGDAAYNKTLSMKRAESLENYLAENFGVSKKQLHPRGFGQSRPVASNDTKDGRQQNRRVEFICCTIIPPE
jgi:OOP family OmpA-OmpF porin